MLMMFCTLLYHILVICNTNAAITMGLLIKNTKIMRNVVKPITKVLKLIKLF